MKQLTTLRETPTATGNAGAQNPNLLSTGRRKGHKPLQTMKLCFITAIKVCKSFFRDNKQMVVLCSEANGIRFLSAGIGC